MDHLTPNPDKPEKKLLMITLQQAAGNALAIAGRKNYN